MAKEREIGERQERRRGRGLKGNLGREGRRREVKAKNEKGWKGDGRERSHHIVKISSYFRHCTRG